MSNISSVIPYVEIYERAMNLAGDDSATSEAKFKGLVNDAYTRNIARIEDWDFLLEDSYISCSAKYNTGTVACSAAGTTITGTSTVWTAGMTATNGWKIKFTGQDHIYTFTYVSGTSATISPGLSGDDAITGNGYVLFRDTYSLASDFMRFLISEEGGLKLMRGGKSTSIPIVSNKKWRDDKRTDPSDVVNIARLRRWDSSNNREIQINPPPKTAIVLPYDYIIALTPMTEYTTGYVSAITNGATGVTGSGTTWNSTANVDIDNYTYYFRVDSDGTGAASVWYKIASVTNATTLVLSSNYGGTSIASGVSTDRYTISKIPNMPSEFHDLLIYMAATVGIANQADPSYDFFSKEQQRIINECKVLYKSRRTSKQIEVEDDGYRDY